jgi:hypothetical protein
MITLEDCIALCGLTEAEVLAIAEHEHVPEIIATGLAETLLKQAHGPETVRHMIIEDIRNAHARGDRLHAGELLVCLKRFLDEHPEAVPATIAAPTTA